MSLVRTVDVFCDGINEDGEQCWAWVHGDSATKPRVDVALTMARTSGWKRRRRDGKTLDLCPVCLENGRNP